MPGKEYTSRPSRRLLKENRQVVTMTITRSCNLRCLYCYESNEKHEKESMDYTIARDIITQFMEKDNEFKNIEFQFFGGEPMLYFALIRDIVDWFHSRVWKKGHIFFITTNGTILTDEMKTWLIKNKKCVVPGFSIDGNRTAHNISRDNSYDVLSGNIPFFSKQWPEQPAKMTICAETIPYVAESIIELEHMGLNFTANLVFEDIWGDTKEKERLLDIYQHQLQLLVEFYTKNPHLDPVSPLLSHSLEFFNQPPLRTTLDGDCIRFCGAGHEMVMIDIDGSQYPCHRFAPWISKRPPPDKLQNFQQKWEPEKCRSCKLISICPTCAGFNWEINGDSRIPIYITSHLERRIWRKNVLILFFH
jgi:uncharacterized protein